MHEMSLMQNALSLITAAINEQNLQSSIKQVDRVYLKVGQMANCLPGALETAFDGLKPGTIFAAAQLVLLPEAVLVACNSCGTEFAGSAFPWQCPNCGAIGGQVLGGTEVYVESIDYS